MPDPDRPSDVSDDIGADRIVVAEFLLRLRQRGLTDHRLLAAIESVPRTLFVPPDGRGAPYAERALPIECGQTISAPELVATMTAALGVGPRDKVLEIGTGSGYQAAILARLAAKVYTVERFRTLAESATSRFRTLKLDNIHVRFGDGMDGWPEQAPFDRIMVTAAGPHVPQDLVDQLRVGGVLVMPVGDPDAVQTLMRFERTEEGLDGTKLGSVRFVPLIPGAAARL